MIAGPGMTSDEQHDEDDDAAEADYAAGILSAFRETECAVKAFDGGEFELVHPRMPAKTHVFANRFFIQLSTFVYLKPRYPWGRLGPVRDRFLNHANQKTSLMKLTCEETGISGLWSVLCRCRFASGEVGTAYSPTALEHLMTLWLQDLARVILVDRDYEVIAMIDRSCPASE